MSSSGLLIKAFTPTVLVFSSLVLPTLSHTFILTTLQYPDFASLLIGFSPVKIESILPLTG